MKMKWILSTVALLVFTGCAQPPSAESVSSSSNSESSADDIALTYSVTVPSHIPETMTFHPKYAPPEQRKARRMYKHAHRCGWDECIADFKSGRLTDKSRPTLKQQYGLTEKAEIDGYTQCRKAIYALIEKHGREAVEKKLK